MTAESNALTEVDAERLRAGVADRIAVEVRHAHNGGEARLSKVTSLLHAFRSTVSSTTVSQLAASLEDAGIHLDSGWPDTHRPGVVKLSVEGSLTSNPSVGDDTIQLSVWKQGGGSVQERPLPVFRQPAEADVLWFNIDPTPASSPSRDDLDVKRGQRAWRRGSSSRLTAEKKVAELAAARHAYDAVESRVTHVFQQLSQWCPGLDKEMVRDLLNEDLQPKVEAYGDENDGVRGASAVAVVAQEAPEQGDTFDEVREELVFQLVETVVGRNWIITCWHPSRIYSGSTARVGPPLLREPFLTSVRESWSDAGAAQANSGGRSQTSGDLGLYLASSLVATYGASHRMMERWVESWEVEFFRCLSSMDKKDKAKSLKAAAAEVSSLLSMVGEFRRRLTAFEHGRLSMTDKSWFPGVSDRGHNMSDDGLVINRVDKLAEAVRLDKDKFTALHNDICADMDLLMLQSQAEQQETTEKLQGYVGKVTGLVLVPTFIAGLFGANTQLPGGGSWSGFDLMLILMVISGLAAFLIIRRLAP